MQHFSKVERVVFNALARSLRLRRLIFAPSAIGSLSSSYGEADPPGASIAAGSSTWLSAETLRKNHDSLTRAGQGEGVESGEAAELDVAGQAQH